MLLPKVLGSEFWLFKGSPILYAKFLFRLFLILVICLLLFNGLPTDSMYALCTVPVIVYNAADQSKDLIVKNNRKKSGIYCWVHVKSGKRYVGSSTDLGRRLGEYYYKYYLTRVRTKICKALLAHGYAAFKLEILEYCTREQLIIREQFFIDTIKPEYNILKVAGSSLGFKHSEETKELMRKLAKSRVFSEKTILKMKKRTMLEEVRLKTGTALKGKIVSPETC